MLMDERDVRVSLRPPGRLCREFAEATPTPIIHAYKCHALGLVEQQQLYEVYPPGLLDPCMPPLSTRPPDIDPKSAPCCHSE
jgi:hypothetical protein